MIKTTSSRPKALNSKFSSMVYAKTITNNEETLADIFLLDDSIAIFQQRLGYKFNNIDFLIRALSHTSYIHEFTASPRKSYERLEFLGDSILGSFVTTSLFNLYPDYSEGKLSKLRSALVNEEVLASLGRYIGACEFVLLGKGELKTKVNDSIVSDVFEAIIGAITLDSTINNAFSVLDQIIKSYQRDFDVEFFSVENLSYFDPKTTLQEITMKKFNCLPEYISNKIDETFEVSLHICGKELCKTISNSKKQAKKLLAHECIKNNLINNI